MRKWRGNEERFTLYISSFSPSLSIFYIKNCLILSQNIKYGTFVANVKRNLTYALWENNSGSNSRQKSSASCEGLLLLMVSQILSGIDIRRIFWFLTIDFLVLTFVASFDFVDFACLMSFFFELKPLSQIMHEDWMCRCTCFLSKCSFCFLE